MTHYDETISRVALRAADPKARTDHASIGVTELPPTLTGAQIVNAERQLGFKIPTFLATVYSRIANGRFGPSYGLQPLIHQSEFDSGPSAIELYEQFAAGDPSDPEWQWPSELLPICDWGCAVHSCVDCSTPTGVVVTCDPGQRQTHEPMCRALAPTKYDVASWLDAWSHGVRLWDTMFERGDSRITVNPFTGQQIEIHKRKLKR